jgi:hypothetical protein
MKVAAAACVVAASTIVLPVGLLIMVHLVALTIPTAVLVTVLYWVYRGMTRRTT